MSRRLVCAVEERAHSGEAAVGVDQLEWSMEHVLHPVRPCLMLVKVTVASARHARRQRHQPVVFPG